MIAKILSRVLFFVVFLAFPTTVLASQPHYTLIINQVRGGECCDQGSLANLNEQLAALTRNNLTATFAVRFDALSDWRYISVLKSLPQTYELAGFLEITPSLASASGVAYPSSLERWYEPSVAFLVGYGQDQRKRLIDTYMAEFKEVFGYFPETTVSWLVDPYSLGYLKQEYGVVAHEITREQWNTDAITLYGGPPHYPYFPSSNWAIVPTASASADMPVIFRQTIADPVNNYGDGTNSHTSQPNDYLQNKRNFGYFLHLFNQAHRQKVNPYTFAVLGLENSMPADMQQEFAKQLDFVGSWAESQNNFVVNARDFMRAFSSQNSPAVISYEGSDQDSASSRAWWVTTPNYRVRLRLDHGRFYISDLRVYNQSFLDPYLSNISSSRAYWVVPYVVDGSRFRQKNSDVLALFNPLSDGLETDNPPVHLLVAKNQNPGSMSLKKEGEELVLVSNGRPVIKFAADYFLVFAKSLDWKDLNTTSAWGLKQEKEENGQKFTPWSQPTDLIAQRQANPAFLLPALLKTDPDPQKTIIYVHNRFSVAGRNPIRILLVPKNDQGYPVAVIDKLEVTTDFAVTNITYSQPDENSGGIFVDVANNHPGKVKVKIRMPNLEKVQEVFFAPDCRKDFGSCLLRPQYLYWYGRNFLQEVYNRFR